MKNLKNWDKKTWLSSDEYISCLIHFLKKQINFNRETKILDIGCGRGKIISTLSKKYRMINLPLGIDIVQHKDVEKKIKVIKINALKYLGKTKLKFDIILFKQSIHFFKQTEITEILKISKNHLRPKGKIIILALHPKKNYWPLFRVFKLKLIKSLKKDEEILNLIKSSFKKYKINYFAFKVKITRDLYQRMVKNRFNSCLLNLSLKEIKTGIEEIKKKYKRKLIFFDKLICITYKKI
jgi:cyclopropane fatty-acyl-phospholipid synthase-like methyltransferase